MAHIQAPGWSLLWAAIGIFGAFRLSPWVHGLALLGILVYHRALYRQGRFVPVPYVLPGAVPELDPTDPQSPGSYGTGPSAGRTATAGTGLPPFLLSTARAEINVSVPVPPRFPDPGGPASATFFLIGDTMQLGNPALARLPAEMQQDDDSIDRLRHQHPTDFGMPEVRYPQCPNSQPLSSSSE